MILFTFLGILIVVGLVSCAADKKNREVNLLWPLPPDPPRVRYIKLPVFNRLYQLKFLGLVTLQTICVL
jgi:hypothetical protein